MKVERQSPTSEDPGQIFCTEEITSAKALRWKQACWGVWRNTDEVQTPQFSGWRKALNLGTVDSGRT